MIVRISPKNGALIAVDVHLPAKPKRIRQPKLAYAVDSARVESIPKKIIISFVGRYNGVNLDFREPSFEHSLSIKNGRRMKIARLLG